MKFPRESTKPKVKANLDMTPLIDVVFQLIIFFMLSATFVVQSSIQIEMPKAEGATQFEQKDLSITLTHGTGGPDGMGRVYLDQEEVFSWEELAELLAEAVQLRNDVRVLIRSDGRVPMARTVRLWSIATSLGIVRFGVAAEPFESDE